MNNIRAIQKLNEEEARLGISENASWHAEYKDSAYIVVTGIPFDLNEGDIIVVCSQFGEVVDCNLLRDRKTGKSRGTCFIAYEDQRSTILAVDNLNGAKLKGRILKVNHIIYKKIRKHKDHDRLDFNEEAIEKVYEEEAEEYEKRRKLVWDFEELERKEKELYEEELKRAKEQEEYEKSRAEGKKRKKSSENMETLTPEQIEQKRLARIEEIKNKHKKKLREQEIQTQRR